MARLAGKVAVVLGASASGGTGWAIAEGLAREDAGLWLAGLAYISGAILPISGGDQLTRHPRTDELPLGGDSYQGV